MNKTLFPAELEVDSYGPLYGARKQVYPQSVSGTFRRVKWSLMAFCLASITCCPSCAQSGGIDPG
jgi:hypothetical protein